MTDNEIIKALECCRENEEYCPDCCPSRYDTECTRHLASKALTIINRKNKTIEHQKETIEQLQTALFKCGEEMATVRAKKDNLIRTYAECQAESVKEFAEKLKKRAVLDDDLLWVTDVDIDNLVKEFTGGADADRAD